MNKFGEAMLWYMDMYDIQYKELSRLTGVSVNTLQNYTSGQNSLPNVENALKIARALHTTVESMYGVPEEVVNELRLRAIQLEKVKKAIRLLQEI